MGGLSFLLKKLISAFLMPLSLMFIALLVALVLAKKKKSLAKLISFVTCLVLYLLSLGPIANAFISPLEHTYEKYSDQKVDYVLVLGGGHHVDTRFPISSHVTSLSLTRLIEGVIIYQQNRGSKLLLSGYEANQEKSYAETAALVVSQLGVPEEDIIISSSPQDTNAEAKYWSKFIGTQYFALVTSASHMPRSVELFKHHMRKLSIEHKYLVPAPTNYRSSDTTFSYWESWFPRTSALRTFEIAWHEYIGLLWSHLTILEDEPLTE